MSKVQEKCEEFRDILGDDIDTSTFIGGMQAGMELLAPYLKDDTIYKKLLIEIITLNANRQAQIIEGMDSIVDKMNKPLNRIKE